MALNALSARCDHLTDIKIYYEDNLVISCKHITKVSGVQIQSVRD